MEIARCFRSGNTVRLTLPRRIRYALDILPGDLITLEVTAIGKVTLTNPTHAAREKANKRSKRK